jgi:hypothetical protein
MQMGLRQRQIGEKRIRHVDVIVLAGVNDYRIGPWLIFQSMVKRSDLHEIWPCSGNEMNFLLLGHARIMSSLFGFLLFVILLKSIRLPQRADEAGCIKPHPKYGRQETNFRVRGRKSRIRSSGFSHSRLPPCTMHRAPCTVLLTLSSFRHRHPPAYTHSTVNPAPFPFILAILSILSDYILPLRNPPCAVRCCHIS